MKIALKIYGLVVVVALLAHVACLLVQPHRRWHVLGPIQVLGGPEEAWLFLEKGIYAERPGWAAHRALLMDCRQEVVVITGAGVQRHIAIPESREITFHQNISRIFRSDDGFYLMRGESMRWHGALYRWDQGHFHLLPWGAYRDFLRANGLGHTRVPEMHPVIDRLTKSNGWECVCREVDWILSPFGFTWNGQRFELEVRRGPAFTAVLLRSLDAANQWDTTVLEFDPTPTEISRGEYNRMWDRNEPGYRK